MAFPPPVMSAAAPNAKPIWSGGIPFSATIAPIIAPRPANRQFVGLVSLIVALSCFIFSHFKGVFFLLQGLGFVAKILNCLFTI